MDGQQEFSEFIRAGVIFLTIQIVTYLSILPKEDPWCLDESWL